MASERSPQNPPHGAGGTPGGVGTFLVGLVLLVVGSYLLADRVVVTSGWWTFFGGHTFGLTLLPVLIGIVLLFVNGRSLPGWLLTGLGLAIIFAGIIANLRIHFRGASLYETLVMLGLIAAGLGLIIRSLRPAPSARPPSV
jgi:hypothetical protein